MYRQLAIAVCNKYSLGKLDGEGAPHPTDTRPFQL